MDANNDPIVIVSTAMNSAVTSVVPNSSVIFLDDSILMPSTINDQPDILQQALDAAITTVASNLSFATSSNAALEQHVEKGAKENNYVTVFNSQDGTLRLTQESARALGISITTHDNRGFSK